MTTDELHDIINGDPTAKALANAGNDTGCLAAIQTLLPKEAVLDSMYTELGVIGAFSDSADAHICLSKLEAAAEVNPVIKRVVKWLGPGSRGLDFGNPIVRVQLDALATAGVITTTERDVLKSLGERTVQITVNDVSAAWARYRG